jgi:exodeoxyribonuclease V alpha subunit
MNSDSKYRLIENGIFSELDIHFGNLIQSLTDDNDPLVFAAAVLVSNFRSSGHVCLYLAGVKRASLMEWEEHFQISFPEIKEWADILRRSSVVGNPGDFKPLILDPFSRLYLNRYYEYQETIARNIRYITKQKTSIPDRKNLADGLDRLFPQSNRGDEVNFQRLAAIVSVHKQLCVISGGPGTGKTTTVTGILSLLLELSGEERLSIVLAAPTGKSAARLRESVQQAEGKAAVADFVKEWIPDKAFTIHRMLGISANTAYAKYNRKNRLPADVVVVDEASMIDISLMAKLLEALRDDAKLILIGDRHQLASVETGSVFSDICGPFETNPFYELNPKEDIYDLPDGNDFVVQLERSYRFEEGSGIGALCKSLKKGDDVRSLSLLHDEKRADIGIKDLPAISGMEVAISDAVIQGYQGFLHTENPMDAINKFDEFRVLCALREGPYGVTALNHIIENVLAERGLIQTKDEWYHGRPVIITGNDYNLGLFNGDTGIAFKDPNDNGSLYVFFNNGDELRKIHPNRLSSFETAYALTVHKSQGSEYDRVLVILPDRVLPIVTRELIYTGITRAKLKVEVLSKDAIFKQGVLEKIDRASGLFDSLWGSITSTMDSYE